MQKRKTDITLDDLKEGSEKVLERFYNENRHKFMNFARRYDISDDDIVERQPNIAIHHDSVFGAGHDFRTCSELHFWCRCR